MGKAQGAAEVTAEMERYPVLNYVFACSYTGALFCRSTTHC